MADYDRDILNNAKMATFDGSPRSDAAKAWIGAIQALTLTHEADTVHMHSTDSSTTRTDCVELGLQNSRILNREL